MNKRFVIWAFLLLTFAGFSIALFYRQKFPGHYGVISQQEIADAIKRLGHTNNLPEQTDVKPLKPLDLKIPIRLAIGSLGLADVEQNRRISDLVLADLTGAQGLNLVERQSLETVLRELGLSLSGLVRAKDAVRAGKLLKADWFLLGTATTINGTNSLVVRVVDARTGILRDAGVFRDSQSPVQLAMDIAEFVRQTRQCAATAKLRTYLAIGAFTDLSVNNRQANFPAQLQSYLTTAYQHTDVALLEREAVNTLLREVQLDLAGLTEDGATNAGQPMQSAYWLVESRYQSYETTNLELEVVLDIKRVIGMSVIGMSDQLECTLRGKPGDPFFKQIKSAIDGQIARKSAPLWLTRNKEARAQLSAGRELANLGMAGLTFGNYYGDATETQRRNTAEAIRAFETALLLEPANREAKMYLAACLRKPTVGRVDEARNYYREILEEPVQDRWSVQAREALLDSFRWSSPQEKAQWFAATIQKDTNSTLAEFYRQNAGSAARDVIIENGGGEAVEPAEKRLLETIRSNKNFMEGKGNTLKGGYGLYDFQNTFKDKSAAARGMADFLPKMESEFPELAPHLTAEVLCFQVDTNSPALAEFQKQLEFCLTHPEKIYHPRDFWASAHGALVWLACHRQYTLAVRTLEGYRAASGQDDSEPVGHNDRIVMGFIYMGAERWKEALEIFSGFSKLPVLMGSDGPWGRGWIPVFPDKEADFCREKLGIPIARNAEEFDMDADWFCMHTPSSFATDYDGLWIVINDELLRLDFNLKTNFAVKLPVEVATPITTMELGPEKIWIGTMGAGLIEYDKISRKCRRYTVEDGLMMDEICSMRQAEDVLWIGYGYPRRIDTGGGIGFLNLSTHQFTSFTRSLTNGTDAPGKYENRWVGEPSDEPPRYTVSDIAIGPAGDVWFLVYERGLWHFRSKDNTWEKCPQVSSHSCCLAAGDGRLHTGQFQGIGAGINSGPIGLSTFDFSAGQWQNFGNVEELPSGQMSALTLDGHDLWAGGMGYVALVSPGKNQVRKFAHVCTETVDKIQVGGGYVWAQFNGHLHRAPLSLIEDSVSSATRSSQQEFLQTNFAKLVPFQFQKDANGAASLKSLNVRGNMIERGRMYYCGFKFTTPAWTDGNLKLMYVMAKTEAEKDFTVAYMNSDIVSENGPSAGSYEYLREDLANYPQLQKQFPYTRNMTTQIFDMKQLEPGKTYGIWFEFDNKYLPDIAFAMTVNSPRGTNEFGMLPLR